MIVDEETIRLAIYNNKSKNSLSTFYERTTFPQRTKYQVVGIVYQELCEHC